MSDVSDPLLTCDADVNGSGATSNYHIMFRALEDPEMSDITDPLLTCDADATLNNNTMDVSSDDLSAMEDIQHVPSVSRPETKFPAVALSGLFSMIEYAKKSVSDSATIKV